MGFGRCVLYAVTISLACLMACQGHNPPKSILPSDICLRPGDIVFRRGMGLTSHTVIAVDRGGRYSHVGIVADSCGTPVIIHAVPGEPDFEGDVDRVKMTTPEEFFLSCNADIGEICRLQDKLKAVCASEIALQLYHRHIEFDHDYDDRDTTRMYCSELVVFALTRAGYDMSSLKHHDVMLPIIQVSCIFPSDIYALPFLKSIAAF